MLVENHYEIRSHEGADWTVYLREDCKVYEGHFPGEPISPGVCNIRILQELAGEMAGKSLRILRIKTCRMTRLIRPGETLVAHIQLEDGRLVANLGDALTLDAEVG